MPTADPQRVPQLVWLPYREQSGADPSVLVVRAGEAVYEPFPMQISSFWDYSPTSGRVAFSNRSWYVPTNYDRYVTDLWVYDYQTEEAQLWVSDFVGSAAWSSTINPLTGTELLAVAIHGGGQYSDILILSDPDTIVATIHAASPHFAWSPDGQWLAFFRIGSGIYIAPATGGSETRVASLQTIRSVKERPLWASEGIIDTTNGLRLSFIQGIGEVRLGEGRLPYQMLWDPENRQLIAGFDGDYGSNFEIKVFQLSESLRRVTDVFVLAEGVWLVDWVVPGESLLLSDGRILDWPIAED